MATTYEWPALRNFVVSLRHANYTGDIVLFQDVSDNTPGLMQKLARYNVKLEKCKTSHPYFPEGTPAHDYSVAHPIPRTPTIGHGMNLRFAVFQLWLKVHRHKYQDVFMSDTRDVVFQKDPFDWMQWKPSTNLSMPLEDKWYPVIENTEYVIQGEWINNGWVQQHYGHHGVSKIGDKHISCSGTTYGSINQMINYLEHMTDALTAFTLDKPEVQLADQPVHNWLIYATEWNTTWEGLIDGRSPVATMALRRSFETISQGQSFNSEANRGLDVLPPLENLPVGVQMYLLNEDKSMPCVVHQYDRHSSLKHTWTLFYQHLDLLHG
jgi:hypothetical protein